MEGLTSECRRRVLVSSLFFSPEQVTALVEESYDGTETGFYEVVDNLRSDSSFNALRARREILEILDAIKSEYLFTDFNLGQSESVIIKRFDQPLLRINRSGGTGRCLCFDVIEVRARAAEFERFKNSSIVIPLITTTVLAAIYFFRH